MRKHLLVYCMNYAPEITGVGRYTGELSVAMAARGFRVDVVTTPPHYPGWFARTPYSPWRYRAERQDGVQVTRCPILLHKAGAGIWRLMAPLSFALSSLPVFLLRALIDRPRVILCVEPTLCVAPAAILAARLLRAKLVLHVQDLEVDAAFAVGHLPSRGALPAIAHFFERVLLKRFDEVVTISDQMAAKLREKGVADSQLRVIRNWVDTTHIFPLQGENTYRAVLGIEHSDFVVQYAGQIGPKQALHVVLEAAERLEHEPGFEFVIAGEGPLKSKLAQRYSGLRNVRFLGLQPEANLNEFLNLADCHVLPQDPAVSELVLPSKLGGMLASGKRIIAMAYSGSEIARFLDGAAELIEPGNVAALVDALRAARKRVVHDPLPALSKAHSLSANTALGNFETCLSEKAR